MASMNPAVQEEKLQEAPSSFPNHPPAISSPCPRVLLESQKQNSMVFPALLMQHHKQGTSPRNTFFSPICKNSWAASGNNTPFPAGRYKSPTDSLISPISRGLLMKGRKAMKQLPAFGPPKVLDQTFDISKITLAKKS